MNVYLFELKRTWKSAVSWSAVLLIMLVVLMAVVYPVYNNARVDVEAAMAGFPSPICSSIYRSFHRSDIQLWRILRLLLSLFIIARRDYGFDPGA